mmetsp:Transcript_62872/g.154640  ORF Transcript_62872/g.154640 Transcript_62872/m.154640 type:complete len:241 (-) Transcript_62872:582-1304(-)
MLCLPSWRLQLGSLLRGGRLALLLWGSSPFWCTHVHQAADRGRGINLGDVGSKIPLGGLHVWLQAIQPRQVTQLANRLRNGCITLRKHVIIGANVELRECSGHFQGPSKQKRRGESKAASAQIEIGEATLHVPKGYDLAPDHGPTPIADVDDPQSLTIPQEGGGNLGHVDAKVLLAEVAHLHVARRHSKLELDRILACHQLLKSPGNMPYQAFGVGLVTLPCGHAQAYPSILIAALCLRL